MPLRFLALLLPVLLHAGCGDDVQSATVDLGAPDLAGPDLAMLPLEGAPCVNDVDCGGPSSLLCQYKIADGCAATGHCVRIVVPTCKGFVELCGCGGGFVESECAYQPGYASAPTTGAPYPMCPGDGGI